MHGFWAKKIALIRALSAFVSCVRRLGIGFWEPVCRELSVALSSFEQSRLVFGVKFYREVKEKIDSNTLI